MPNKNNTSIDKVISSQIKYWRQQREKTGKVPRPPQGLKETLPFITISREYGCGGFEVAEEVAAILTREYRQKPPWAAYDRRVLEMIMKDMGLSSSLAETLTSGARAEMTNLFQTTFSKFPAQVAVYRKLAETVRTLAANGHVIIIGRAGNVITRDMERGYHVRIVAALDWRTERMAALLNVRKKEAEKIILAKMKKRDTFIRKFIKFDLADPHNYHIVINNARHTVEEAGRLIIEGLRVRGLLV